MCVYSHRNKRNASILPSGKVVEHRLAPGAGLVGQLEDGAAIVWTSALRGAVKVPATVKNQTVRESGIAGSWPQEVIQNGLGVTVGRGQLESSAVDTASSNFGGSVDVAIVIEDHFCPRSRSVDSSPKAVQYLLRPGARLLRGQFEHDSRASGTTLGGRAVQTAQAVED